MHGVLVVASLPVVKIVAITVEVLLLVYFRVVASRVLVPFWNVVLVQGDEGRVIVFSNVPILIFVRCVAPHGCVL
jgi:hypothetical protein